MQRDLIFWVWLAERLGARSSEFRDLIIHYETAYELFHMEEEELERIHGLSERTKAALGNKDLTEAAAILKDCEQKGIGILTFGDPAYPKRLKDITAPPIVLYYLGTLPDFDERLCVAMVGTRSMSEYGLKTAYRLAYELSGVGALVVSGMAQGIDGVSSAAAIHAGGDSVAVLGCGVDTVYPKHHARLKEEICRHGAVLSEYKPGTPPMRHHFPARNRIISGLSQGTLVVEAGLKSGTLITAKDAVLQGRTLFAVPANVGSRGAQGTNGLLRDGAIMVLETEDVLRTLAAYAPDVKVWQARLAQIGEQSRADLRVLADYGVLEIVEQTEPRERGVRDVYTAPAPRRERKTAKKAKPAAEGAGKRSDETGEQMTIPAETPKIPRESPIELMKKLSPVQFAVMQAIPDDRPCSTDDLGRLEYPYGEIVAALTMLEILGYVKKLPGSLYTKL